MSTFTILSVCPETGTAEYLEELRNSWHGAIIAWELVWNRYGTKLHEYDGALSNGAEDGRLWELQRDQRMSRAERVVFCLTFTRFYVKQQDFPRLADDIGDAFGGNPPGHWPHLVKLLHSQPDVPALGFWWTSVAENPFAGDWNEEREEYDPIDPNMMVNVYEHITNLESEFV
ncbi:hypothetical protein [Novosphingobium sp. ST904]|uniref:hypothetical protein n=1 Tax=Novosphingobium sp. ST904 TaxID=1684385 RepID=UPI0006C8D9F0|nr:hypothetical protein [Novosphingobium sp. ST904]KPH60379.1 hypothetical protein ADT71_19930 [Novosphingobium sp. ST904]TCM40067.1 hypothetical protein EDF59_105307 [Novosphingobium sp. ST904]